MSTHLDTPGRGSLASMTGTTSSKRSSATNVGGASGRRQQPRPPANPKARVRMAARTARNSATTSARSAGRREATGQADGPPQLQIKDSNGTDVTPVSLFDPNRRRTLEEFREARDGSGAFASDVNWAKRIRASRVISAEDQAHHLSTSLTAVASNVSNRPSIASIADPETLMAAKASATAPRLSKFSEVSPELMAERQEEEKQEPDDDVEGLDLPSSKIMLSEQELSMPVHLVLEETDTIDIFEMPSTFVDPDDEDGLELVEAQQQRLKDFRQRLEASSGAFAQHGTQTACPPTTSRACQASSAASEEVGCQAAPEDIYDSMQAADDTLRRVTSPKLLRSGSRLASAVERVISANRTRRHQTAKGVRIIHDKEIEANMEGTGTDTGSSQQHRSLGFGIMQFKVDPTTTAEKRHQDWQRVSGLPVFQAHCAIVQRILNQPEYRKAHSIVFADDTTNKDGEDATLLDDDQGKRRASTSTLETLWTYVNEDTRNRPVLCSAENPQSPLLVATGYGGDGSVAEDSTGLVCCWSAKNPEVPERIFRLRSPATSLTFSPLSPNLLCAGCQDGSLHIFDLHRRDGKAILDTLDNEPDDKHTQAVTTVQWVDMRGKRNYRHIDEMLVSSSGDGRVLHWTINKGLQPAEIMAVKRLTSDKSVKTHKGNSKTAFIARQAGVTSMTFSPADAQSYIVATDMGPVHGCSLAFQDSFTFNYFEHGATSNSVAYNPLAPDVFATCSDDWRLCVWQVGKSKPLATFEPGSAPLLDLAWSNLSPTVLAAISQDRLYVWDLQEKEQDPVLSLPLGRAGAALTTVAFSNCVHGVLLGTQNGSLLLTRLQLANGDDGSTSQKKVLGNATKAILESASKTFNEQ